MIRDNVRVGPDTTGEQLGRIERSVVNPRVWVPIPAGPNDLSAALYAGTKRQAMTYFDHGDRRTVVWERDGEHRLVAWEPS